MQTCSVETGVELGVFFDLFVHLWPIGLAAADQQVMLRAKQENLSAGAHKTASRHRGVPRRPREDPVARASFLGWRERRYLTSQSGCGPKT